MTRNRTIRIALGIAAGVVVLLAALAGGALRPDDATNVASTDAQATGAETAVADDVPTEIETASEDTTDTSDDTTEAAEAEGTQAESTDAESTDAEGTEAGDTETDPDGDDATSDSQADTDGDTETDSQADSQTATDGDAEAATDTGSAVTGDDDADAPSDDSESADDSDASAATTTDDAAPLPTAEPAAVRALVVEEPASPASDGGPVCSLDRLVIYAGAQRSGVGQAMRAALPQLGFGTGCAQPVTVLAANCPLQFSGVLGAGAPYDPTKPYVAASSAVDNEALLAVLNTVSDSGTIINTLDFGYAQNDKPGEQWIAVFIPPSFDGWQRLASAAGVAPTTQSLCTANGRVG